MSESAQATSFQQEAEAQLLQSQQTIQELQTALKNAQVGLQCHYHSAYVYGVCNTLPNLGL